MDYASNHHQWRPLAAISAREEVRTLVTVPTTILTTLNAPAATLKSSLTSTLTSAITRITSVTPMEDSNDVWHALVFKNGSDALFERTARGDDYEFLNGSFVIGNGTFGNATLILDDTGMFLDSMWAKVTVIGTAVALGLIILATVIGELILRIFERASFGMYVCN